MQYQAIAIHTFMVLVLEWRDRGPVSLSTALVVAVWVCTALIVGIPNAVHHNAPADQPYYGNTGNCTFSIRLRFRFFLLRGE